MKKLIILLVFCSSISITNFSISQWVQVSDGMGIDKNVYSFTIKDGILFAGVNGYGVYYSSNNGVQWIQTSLQNVSVNALTTKNSDIYAGTNSNGVYISSNNGLDWTRTSLNASTIYSLTSNDSYIISGYDNGIYKTTNKGLNWSITGLPASTRSLCTNGNFVFAGSMGGVFVSTNYGQSFYYGTLSSNYVLSLYYLNNILYAGTAYYGIYKSTNNGLNFIHTSLDTVENYAFANYNNSIFAGGGRGVFLSTNNGLNWYQRNEGMGGNFWVTSLITLNGFIFAGTPNHGLWRRSLNDFTSVVNETGNIPEIYLLAQNYPNPFNPSTIIKYQLIEYGYVSLKVYDALGKQVGIPVNEKQTPGNYEVTFDGSNLPSGIYFYKIETNNFSDVKKMILLK